MSGHKVSILFYEIAMLIVFSKNAVLIKKKKKEKKKDQSGNKSWGS